MSGSDSAFLCLESLERQMHRIQRDAPLVFINRAQCALLALRLRTVFETLNRLPDPLPSPQLFTVFNSADMIIQQMKSDWWKHILLRDFTCSRMFRVLFERIGKAWRLHMTTSWDMELKAAVEKDEIENASLCVKLLQQGEKISFSSHMIEDKKSFFANNASTFTEEQLINFFCRRQLSGWKLSFEELTPPDVGPHTTTTTTPKIPFVFDMYCGYCHNNKAVHLHMLEESKDGTVITPSTITAFVQDMVSRSSWCHPNLVPFLGAFTEKTSRCNDNALVPVLAIGFITEDVTHLAVSCSHDENNFNSRYTREYIFLKTVKQSSKMTHFSLYDALFVRRQRFTIKEAIGITLQVADALQYILMDKNDVPNEVVTAWISVSPSNIFLCPININSVTTGTGNDGTTSIGEKQRSHNSQQSNIWGTSLNGMDGVDPSQYCADNNKKTKKDERLVYLPFTGKFSVMYSPPVYVEDGPFSRWRPHPHAANPARYALTQLFISMISNEPPYRAFFSQKDLATNVFDVVNDHGDYHGASLNASSQVKVSIPIGCAIPTFLPQELRQLCARGLFLLHPSKKRTSVGNGLREFIEDMRRLYNTALDVFCHVSAPKSSPRHFMQSTGSFELAISAEPSCFVEMTDVIAPLGDYGDIPTSKCSTVVK